MVLVFDADGVVIHASDRFWTYLDQALEVPRQAVIEYFDGVFPDLLAGRGDIKEALAPVLPGWGWRGTVEDFLNRWFVDESHVDDELIAIIQDLRKQGYTCAVATNQEKYRLRYLKEQMGFDRLFDRVFGSADVGDTKPHAGFYREVTARLGVEPHTIVFWDDKEENVVAARACGWHAEQYTGRERFLSSLDRYLKGDITA